VEAFDHEGRIAKLADHLADRLQLYVTGNPTPAMPKQEIDPSRTPVSKLFGVVGGFARLTLLCMVLVCVCVCVCVGQVGEWERLMFEDAQRLRDDCAMGPQLLATLGTHTPYRTGGLWTALSHNQFIAACHTPKSSYNRSPPHSHSQAISSCAFILRLCVRALWSPRLGPSDRALQRPVPLPSLRGKQGVVQGPQPLRSTLRQGTQAQVRHALPSHTPQHNKSQAGHVPMSLDCWLTPVCPVSLCACVLFVCRTYLSAMGGGVKLLLTLRKRHRDLSDPQVSPFPPLAFLPLPSCCAISPPPLPRLTSSTPVPDPPLPLSLSLQRCCRVCWRCCGV
jgi:hypothetical protein